MKMCYAIPCDSCKASAEGNRCALWKEKKIMQLSEGYMQNLKQWLRDTADSPLEEMSERNCTARFVTV